MRARVQTQVTSSGAAGPPPPPRRAAGRPASRTHRRHRLLAVAVVLTALLAIAWGVSVSPLLDIDHLQVRGVHHLTASDIETAAGVHRGDAMLWIDTNDAVRRLDALPYVRDARLSRQWPDTVRITVRERRPAAWLDGPAAKVVVDGSGRVLERVDAPPPATPQLLGAKVVPPPGGTIDATDAARVAGQLTGLAAAGTRSVETTDHGIVLHLASGPEIRMGDATQVAVKLRAALAVLGASADVPLTYVDVSVPTNPVAG